MDDAQRRPLSRTEFFRRFATGGSSPSPSLAAPAKPPSPVVISGGLATWPALAAWRNLASLRERHGHRTVPIEIGQHLGGTWREQSVTLAAFIDDYLSPSAGAWPRADAASSDVGSAAPLVGYLAQHGLFAQIPALADDFSLPLYVADEVGAVNVWIGTAGTRTRLHFDAYDNLLCQVAGYKFVRLVAPAESGLLYVIGGGGDPSSSNDTTAQGNISAVDAETPDLAAHPLFGGAHPVDCLLGPGDALFIPKGWWHYVRALTVSASVNFWW